jgi:N-methylhydantoinase A/oxoprolinase/acetone carboxylase beta subunit
MAVGARGGRERFLLMSVSTAGGPASLRVQVWRKLRSLGALYLQQSVCLLPARERLAREVVRLLARVHAQGATGRVVTIEVPDEREHAALVAEFNAARDAEYAEVLERTPAMLAEIATETSRGRASYAEVEESEADLDRFRSWLAKIVVRDYFGAPGRAAAEAAVAECARALAEFEAAALSAETGTDVEQAAVSPAARRARLTVVDGG